MRNKRKILITSALPYANGSIHLGHLVEYVQTDIWTRFQKLMGNECFFVCADDAHGTPIMLRAKDEGIEPEELISRMHKEHSRDFRDFHINFDNYHSTHSSENEFFSGLIYQRIKDAGHITRKVIKQAYDPEAKMFLPDRFVKGVCPKCNAEDQYGDNCESCGATYSPTDLLNPVSAISGATPIEKDSEHLFFKLSNFQSMLEKWHKKGHVQSEMANKMSEWLKVGLSDWDISRDAPYFGFLIPGEKDKYFYVWLDAPIGYIASFKNLCDKKNINFDSYFQKDSSTELYHFIGKDIINFHALFWPAMLFGSEFRMPTAIFAHGFLTINGSKMSKSRGTFIKARTYLNHLDPNYLRYYFSAKLNSKVEDIDLSLDDFIQRVNSDLVGKLVNIASRNANFISKNFEGMLSADFDSEDLYSDFVKTGDLIEKLYEDREFSSVVREIMSLANKANQYIDEKAPWVLAKENSQSETLHQTCSLAINLFRILICYIKPILPDLASRTEKFLNIEAMTWESIKHPLFDHRINKYEALITRVEKNKVALMVEDAKKEVK
tara:strand:- start:50633 stop:52285 length:1653 start_codon:yes stop_codon:yes gene_type:complete